MFIDIRDFTPFAEAHSAEDTVARLNALFELVVPAVVDAGGHINKFLGDGAMVVFGAPNDLTDSCECRGGNGAADSPARRRAIRRRASYRYRYQHREGDRRNHRCGKSSRIHVDRRHHKCRSSCRAIDQDDRDAILLTAQTVRRFRALPAGLVDRGAYALKGKSAPTKVFGLNPATA